MKSSGRFLKRTAGWVYALALILGPALGNAAVEPLCGDVKVDGFRNAADVTTFRRALADPEGSPLSSLGQSHCDTYGDNQTCDILDVVVLQREIHEPSLAPGVQPVCPGPIGPITPEDTPGVDPNSLGGSPTPPVAYPVGTVDASFDVNPSGAATYTIPIEVPPGTRGIQPRISLGYNSQGAFGLAGVGFELNGLSNIERCAQTIAQDGQPGTIEFGPDDRFCLDGLRLVALDGTYGANNTRYATEGETWTRLRSYGTCDGNVQLAGEADATHLEGPCHFEGKLKNGTEIEYGGPEAESCSVIGAGREGDARFNWPLTRLSDLRGNTLSISYRPGGNHRCVPDRIDYTSNPDTGAEALRSVRFEYGTNVAVVSQYFHGIPRSQSVKLDRIETYIVEDETDLLVKQYQLDYELGSHTLRPRLISVTECDGFGACFPPTLIEWQNGDWMNQLTIGDAFDVVPDLYRPLTLAGDFNGDGHADFIQPGGTSYQYRSDGQAFHWLKSDWGWSFDVYDDLHITERRLATGDFDGDGFTDLLLLGSASTGTPAGFEWRMFRGALNGITGTFAFHGASPSLNDKVYVGDFTGDGRADLVTLDAGSAEDYDTFRLYASTGTDFTYVGEGSFGNWDTDYPFCEREIHPGDFNGDGMVDILATCSGITKWKLFLSNGSSFDLVDGGIWPHGNYRLNPADYNGDGLTDILLTGTDWAGQQGYLILFSTGRRLLPKFHVPYTAVYDDGGTPVYVPWGYTGIEPDWDDRPQVADFNLDGMDDILVTGDGYDELKLYRSTGSEFLLVDSKFKDRIRPVAAYPSVDGRTLVLRAASNPDVAFVPLFDSYANASEPDLIRRISNGVGAQIEMAYGSMSGQIHTKSFGSIYPERDFIATRGLVQRVRKHSGGGDIYNSYYSYQGAKSDLQGRGFLGFETVEVEEPSQRKRTVTEYHIDFPFAGSVKSQEIWGVPPSPIEPLLQSRTEFQYADVSTIPGIREVVVTSERTTTFDDQGTSIATSGKDYEYDAYGNVTKISDFGDLSDPSYDLFTETSYHIDTVFWRIGYPLEVEVYQNPLQPLSRQKFEYDGDMNTTFEGRWDAAHAQFLGTTHEYDAYGNVLESYDPLGQSTSFEYDAFGFLTTTTNPLGHVLSRHVDPRFGIEIERTDANGNSVYIVPNGFGETMRIEGRNPSGQLVALQRFSKTSVGFGFVNQTFQRRHWDVSPDPEWDWKEELHDGLGRPYATRRRGADTSAIASEIEYEGLDLVDRESRAHYEGESPSWIDYSYDTWKRLVQVELPGNKIIQTVFDDAQRQITKIDPNLEQAVLITDPRGKLAHKTDPRGAVTSYSYDGLGRVTEIADAAGPLTQTVYDSLGRRVSVNDRNTGLTTFSYDSTGHLIGETDAKGQHIGRSYDALDRTVDKLFYPAGASTPSRITHFDYDDTTLSNAVGELSRVTMTVGAQVESTYAFAYDDYGRQTRAWLSIDGRDLVWSKAFDPAGHNAELSYPDGAILHTTHNSAGNLDRLQVHEYNDAPGYYTTHARYVDYDAEGRPGLLFHANGVVTCYRYDNDSGLLTQTRTASYTQSFLDPCAEPGEPGETPLLDYTYAWDDVNNLASISDNLEPDRSQSFAYNNRGELIWAQGAYGTRTYGYDHSGNLTSQNGAPYLYDGHRVMEGNFNFLTYDDNGNMTTKVGDGSSWSFTWDEEDQLEEVDKDGVTTRYWYDFAGRRIKKENPEGVTYYVGASYEIFVAADGEERHTKYVPGPAGNLAQITRTDVILMSMAPATWSGVADLYDSATLVGALQSARYRTQAWLASSLDLDAGDARRALAALALACALLAGIGWLRTAGKRSRTGRARAAFVRSLSEAGCADRAWALAFAEPYATAAVRRQPGRLVVVPVVLFAFLASYGLGSGGIALAQLQPTPYGPGVPADGVYYIHSNHIGSTLLVTDPVGLPTTQIEYEPYGRIYAAGSSGSDISRPKFTGQEWDDSAGLYYFNARYYDPALGRFIGPDPGIGGDALKTVSLNRYAYAGNNPITYTDPSGRFIEWVFIAVVAVAAVAGALLLGTEGKILTDTAHAFDNWSWNRAIVGAWLGIVAAVSGFALGTLGAATGATLLGVPIGKVAVTTFGSGVASAAFAYAGGERDPGNLLGYFGVGMLLGFVSGTGGLGLAGHSVATKLTSEGMTAMLASTLKKAIDPDNPLTLQVWAFSLSFNKDEEVEFGANWFFLGSQALTTLVNADGFDASAAQRMRDAWDWKTLSQKLVDPAADTWGLSSLRGVADLVGTPGYGAPGGGSIYGLMQSVVKGVVSYGVDRALTAGGFDQNALDHMNFGLDKGFGAASGGAMDAYRKELENSMLKEFSGI